MNKRVFAAILLLAFALALAAPTFAVAEVRGVAVFEEFIAPQYEDAGIFSEGFAPVKMDGKWGFIDLENELIIPYEYDYASYFSEGYAVVGKHGTRTYMNWEWDYVNETYIPYDLEVIYMGRVDCSGEYKPFMYLGYNFETYDEEIQEYSLSAEDFDFMRSYYYFGGWVNIDNCVFDVKGEQFKTIDDERYLARYAPTEGLVAAWDSYSYQDGVRYLDMSGKVALNLSGIKYYDRNNREVSSSYSNWNPAVRYAKYICDAWPFNQGLAAAFELTYDYETWEETIKAGFIDRQGRWVIAPQYDNRVYRMDYQGAHVIFNDEGLASAGQNGKFGAINKAGRTRIPFRYDQVWAFREGLAVYELGGLFGYINTAGEEVIPAKYAAATGFLNGYAVVSDGSKAMLIDSRGNLISGGDTVLLDAYYIEHDDGRVTTRAPGTYVTIVVDGEHGFGKLSYSPLLPSESEMSQWAYEEVVSAIEADLVPNSLQNQYRSNITRADYCLLVIHAICAILEKDVETLVYDETGKSLNDWVADYRFSDARGRTIAAANALGLVFGYDDGTFRPYNHISRQEASVLLWRAAGLLGMDNENPPASAFADRDRVSAWASKEVDYVSYIKVMNGITADTFDPLGTYTRQQSYMTIFRLLQAERDENARGQGGGV